MKRLLFLFLSPCLLMLGSPASYGAQVLLNPYFEDIPHNTAWTPNNGNVQINDYSQPTNFAVPGPPPDGNGGWGAQLEVAFGSKSGNITQNVQLPAGTYKISASALVRIFDNSASADPSFTSSIRLDLRADSTSVGPLDVIEQKFFEHNRAIHGGRWSPWTTMQTQEYTVNVNSRVGIRVVLTGNGQEGDGGIPQQPFAQLVADSIQLHAELIPEPASLILGCVGALGCIATLRRRRPR